MQDSRNGGLDSESIVSHILVLYFYHARASHRELPYLEPKLYWQLEKHVNDFFASAAADLFAYTARRYCRRARRIDWWLNRRLRLGKGCYKEWGMSECLLVECMEPWFLKEYKVLCLCFERSVKN